MEPKIINKFSQIIALGSCIAVACSGMLMSTGCGTEHVASSKVALEIRFQDDGAAAQQQSAGLRRLASATPGPTTHDSVARILVDVTFADSGRPFFTSFDLTKLAPDVWRGDVPFLPRDQELRFAARALSAAGDVGFSGETVATLTVDNQDVQIPLAPAQNGQTFQMPRLFRIAYPGEIQAGAEEQIAFTILDNAGASVAIQITSLGNPMTPSADFSPATGTVTLTNTVADFMTVYTAPVVTTDTDFDYQVTIIDSREQSAVAITTNFRTHIIPRPPGTPIVHNIHPSVLFNPVIRSLNANGSDTPGTVELVADVSDDSTPDHLTVQWSYAPNNGTPDATFTNGGLGNPGLFQGYTVDHQGTITLAVTDENNGTTTLHYSLTPGQFSDAIDHFSVNGLKRIVSGTAHNCVLTDQHRVRCWGDNTFGQLGYGNAINVGDAPTRLPFTASDVLLPVADPVQQLVAGNNHTCVLLESGLVYCWGDNRFGQLGYNRTDNLGDDEPVTSFGVVTVGDLATRIAAGGDHTCAILQSGAVRCWGRNNFGQLGRGNTDNIGDNETVFSAGSVDLEPGVTVKDLALGGFHTCALLTTGAVRCWGRNDVGQLGYGNTNNLGDDEPIDNLPNVSLTGTVRKLVAGAFHTCALTFAGTLRCWGRGSEGQLGQSFSGDSNWGNASNELPSTLPSDIITGAQVTDVAAGDFHTCALSSDGLLKCWGDGDNGQLGYGNTNRLPAPLATGVNLDGVTAYRVSAGTAHTCALRSNGTARCWGAGADGRLGRGSTATSATATGNVDIQIFTPLPECKCSNGQECQSGVCPDLHAWLLFTFAGPPQNFTVPAGVTSLNLVAVGGGGGGGGGHQCFGHAAGGAAGGAVSAAPLSVTPGTSFAVIVGNGGSGAAAGGNGIGGGDSQFGQLVIAKGGGGGSAGWLQGSATPANGGTSGGSGGGAGGNGCVNAQGGDGGTDGRSGDDSFGPTSFIANGGLGEPFPALGSFITRVTSTAGAGGHITASPIGCNTGYNGGGGGGGLLINGTGPAGAAGEASGGNFSGTGGPGGAGYGGGGGGGTGCTGTGGFGSSGAVYVEY